MATIPTAIERDNAAPIEADSQWRLVLRRFLRHRLAIISLAVLVVIFGASIFAPVIAPFPRDEIVLGAGIFLPPGSVSESTGRMHILGTDQLGRDYFTRLLYAARVSLTVAVISSILSTIIGLVLGLLAGYFGGWTDVLITRSLEFVATFPLLIILLIMVSLLVESAELIPIPDFVLSMVSAITSVDQREARVISLVILTLSLLYWTGTARLMRGMVLSVREQPYIESSRALGGSHLRVLAKHVFPNAYPPLIVDFTLALNNLLVLESSLSFLGFGIQDPTPTWGNMLAFAQSFMFLHPWVPLVPGLPILLTSLAINYVGDGLRDALDPHQKL
jgi:peptide/nickel transport system permease protein